VQVSGIYTKPSNRKNTYNRLTIVNQGKTKTHFGRIDDALTHYLNLVNFKNEYS